MALSYDRFVDKFVQPALLASFVVMSMLIVLNVRMAFAYRMDGRQDTFAASPMTPATEVVTTGEMIRRLKRVEDEIQANAQSDSGLATRVTIQETDMGQIMWLMRTMAAALVGQYIIMALGALMKKGKS